MEALTAALESGPANKGNDEFYKPRQQSHYFFTEDHIWSSASSKQVISASRPAVNPTKIRLMSWNIDMLVPFGNERMTAALQYLEVLVTSTPSDTAIVIFLQEMTSSDINLITSSDWIQTRFNITDKDSSSWLSTYYGTTTLIDHRLSISSVFRVPFLSKYSRDGLFVDVALSTSEVSASSKQSAKVLRLCNVHLESLVADPPVRPRQLSTAAAYLHAPEVACAFLAGDLNAIEPFDRTLHSENNLQDAYLSLGGEEHSDDGYTWGYQVPAPMRERFGCSRMDKILFCGDARVKGFERIGAGVMVAEEELRGVRHSGEETWVSDHYGVTADFDICEDWMLRTNGGDEEAMRYQLMGVAKAHRYS